MNVISSLLTLLRSIEGEKEERDLQIHMSETSVQSPTNSPYQLLHLLFLLLVIRRESYTRREIFRRSQERGRTFQYMRNVRQSGTGFRRGSFVSYAEIPTPMPRDQTPGRKRGGRGDGTNIQSCALISLQYSIPAPSLSSPCPSPSPGHSNCNLPTHSCNPTTIFLKLSTIQTPSSTSLTSVSTSISSPFSFVTHSDSTRVGIETIRSRFEGSWRIWEEM